MTSETRADNSVAGSYTYHAEGQRVRRSMAVSGQPSSVIEPWQVYGFGGELLAEYAANVSAASPQKEYGYRNGQLLITADVPSTSGRRTNVALAANGAVASASSIYGAGYAASAVTNGSRSGSTAGSNGNWNDAPPAHTFPDWVAASTG